MRVILIIFSIAVHVLCNGQPVLKAGDLFPSLVIRNIINAPVKEYDVQVKNNKLLILNFWGTWCSPCLPEMDSLSVLQLKNRSAVQVIAISDEPTGRLKKYLQRRPSQVWLASDTNVNLYLQFGFSYVGQSAVIDKYNRIVALVRTDSINQSFIDRLLRGEPVTSSAEVGSKPVSGSDPFVTDSTLKFQVSWSSYRAALSSMRKTYPKTTFEGRRLTYCNACITNMLKDAYNVSEKQVVYEVAEKTVCNWNDKSTLYCLDLLVKPEQKDSLLLILQQTLSRLAPVKVRVEKRILPVYVLRCLPGAAGWPTSATQESTFSFSGRGFEGKGITIEPFADYVSNELELPVINETELSGKYDITTENVLRTKEDMMNSLKKLGLSVEKTNREMEVIVIF